MSKKHKDISTYFVSNKRRLSHLAIISIHKTVAQELNVESIIDEFAKTKRWLSFINEFN